MCDMTHFYAWHDSCVCQTCLIHMCTMTHSYIFYDSFKCVPWLIHMCDVPRWKFCNPHVCICIKNKTRTHSEIYLDENTFWDILGWDVWSKHVWLKKNPKTEMKPIRVNIYIYMCILGWDVLWKRDSIWKQLSHTRTHIYIYSCIHIYTYIYIYMSVYIHIYICACVCIYMYVYEFASLGGISFRSVTQLGDFHFHSLPPPHNGSSHTCRCAHVNKVATHIHEWVMSHICMSHFTYTCEQSRNAHTGMSHVTHV